MILRVGCAMWAYKVWQGRHFPEHLARNDQLPTYASWCNAVEGNTTYYGVPAERTVRAWAREAPPDFRFMFKLPKTITHEHRLREMGADFAAFLQRIEPLGERAGQLSIQLPKSFGPTDLEALAMFLRRLPASHRFGVEIRHRSFYEVPALEMALTRLLGEAGVEWISLDTTTLYRAVDPSAAERAAQHQKPQLERRLRALTDHPVVRYIGVDDLDETRAGWQPWVPVVAAWLEEGRTPTVFVHTPDNLDAPVLARQFHDDVRAAVGDLDPLPEPCRPDPPPEPTLF